MKSRIPNSRTEKILNSLEGLQKAGAPDFLYTRLLGRMQSRLENAPKTIFLLRPAFLTTALSVVLLANIVALQKLGSQQKSSNTNKATIESFATAYNLNGTTSY
jgi:hypothetical protein